MQGTHFFKQAILRRSMLQLPLTIGPPSRKTRPRRHNQPPEKRKGRGRGSHVWSYLAMDRGGGEHREARAIQAQSVCGARLASAKRCPTGRLAERLEKRSRPLCQPTAKAPHCAPCKNNAKGVPRNVVPRLEHEAHLSRPTGVNVFDGGWVACSALFAVLLNSMVSIVIIRDRAVPKGIESIIRTINEQGETAHVMSVIQPS